MIFNDVKAIIEENLKLEDTEVSIDTKFYEDLNVDSLEIFDLVLSIEEKFDIELENEELIELETVRGLIECIESKL